MACCRRDRPPVRHWPGRILHASSQACRHRHRVSVPRPCLSASAQLRADCRTDPRLLAAYAALDPGGVAAAVALRCEELLAGMAPMLRVPA